MVKSTHNLTPNAGSASLEFVTLGLLLLVPLIYLVLTLSVIQQHSMSGLGAAASAARSLARTTPENWGTLPEQLVNDALHDKALTDLTEADLAVEASCLPQPCHYPTGIVTVIIRRHMPLPFMPEVFGVGKGFQIESSVQFPLGRFAR